MKSVLITGVAGFIGSNLARRCIAEGWDVDGVDDLSNGYMRFLPRGMREFHVSDFADLDFVTYSRIVNGKYDTVFHLAALPRVGYSVEHPIETNDTNVTKTLKLMQTCVGNIKRFIFASSSSVYGNAESLPTHESAEPAPQSPYALQKLIVEDYLQMYSALYGLDSASLRFFNVFGPNQVAGGAYATAVSSWLNAIKRGEPMRSDGDGSQSRDLCYIDNVVDACIKAARSTRDLNGSYYNVACGDRTTNKDVLEYLMRRYPLAKYVGAPWRKGDVMHTHANIDRAKDELGYRPTVHVWDGIDRTCTWYDENWSWVSDMKQGV